MEVLLVDIVCTQSFISNERSGEMRIGIIGAGRIGGGLAGQLTGSGHEVLLSFSRDTRRLDELARRLGAAAQVGTVAEAARFGPVVVLSTPWRLVDHALAAAGDLTYKIVIDTTNHYGAGGIEDLGGRTAARHIAERMPGARLVKSFNTLTSGFQAEASLRQKDRVVQFLTGDDEEAKELVARLIRDAGFEPCDLGGLDDATPMEAPRRPGAVYGEEYRLADAVAARAALAEGHRIPPTPRYDG
jgi:8-hydroxy-5-deazaflavin:NADPH oxidoreductase